MKNKIIILSAAVALLISGGLAFAGFDSTPQSQYVGPPFGSTPQPEYLSQKGEQVTTNVLLRQILAELIKANSLKEERRCSDGDRHYSAGYIISVDKKTLRCDTGSGYPEWVEGGKS
ncbi:hypothetical protein AZ026_005279 [Klebsiella pneumoniae]|uniref:hypothetical protein n=1 Tax=Enterobacteriaceae TaxID=543 RepID=UPI000A36A8F7|nr:MULTISPECIES: hypothetical protein [Enterobacteriaceae]EDY1866325.1 hypothetical protein [Salmonella enterica subsp. enterica serovar Typhimurium]EGO0310573.1 hypothetical protein [Salmonella enterica subsp. enterica serovar Typhimurium]EGO1962842.1 hypothetical protein [Salmonella enterica subsp. enterica serovar Typhimurium]OUF72878.1 hypothetical protein AZ024_004723 [Escherichia coli]OUH47268.1 hypothetical protein AZ026_005279 [Klebsiella pneumoniae]